VAASQRGQAVVGPSMVTLPDARPSSQVTSPAAHWSMKADVVWTTLGTLFAVVTFGVLTANIALKSKDPAQIQAIFPLSFLMIFLTTGLQTNAQIESPVLRRIIDLNPTEHVLQPMRHLMLDGYDWPSITGALLVTAALALIGVPFTIRNYRSVYR
jgi:ABC-type polysaccharide/polyol phosphate export permease